MNKRTVIFHIFIISFAILISAGSAFAQLEQFVQIKNNSGEVRKICAYKGHDLINIVAKKCITLSIGETKYWDRDGENWEFKVKIFESRKLIDKYLYARELPGDTTKIIIGEGGRFGFSRNPIKLPEAEYKLKVCNQNYGEIFVAFAFEVNNETSSHGWWGLKKGDCQIVAVSKLMKAASKIEYGNYPKTYFYAKEHGTSNPKVWTGGAKGKYVCLNTKAVFALRQVIPTDTGGLKSYACAQDGEKIIQFRAMGRDNLKDNIYYLTF